jgi:CHAD domain-containing protein
MVKAKVITEVSCDAPAQDGIQLVLRMRLEEMCSLRERALDFSDPEGVHDMRVASRRLRTALRDFSPYLRKTKITAWLKQVKSLADILGQVRDRDVAIMGLEELAKKAPPEITAGIQRLIESQKGERDLARKDLMVAINGRAISELKSNFRLAIQESRLTTSKNPVKDGGHEGTVASYNDFASITIRDRLKELEHLSSSLYQPTRTGRLHQMRIAAKRFRYALELFAPCWGESINSFAKQAARMQGALGELHDYDIWIEDLGKKLNRRRKGKAPADEKPEDRAAMIWLLSEFTKRRTKHFREALARWHEWEMKDSQTRLVKLLNREPS